MTFLCSICAGLVAWSVAKPLPPINPDRPDFTDGSGITPQGHALLEIGYRQSSGGGVLHEWGDQPTLRFGLNDRFEVRGTLPARAIADGQAGWEDAALGFKWLLRDGGDKSPNFALEAGASLPSGSREFRSNRSLASWVAIVDAELGEEAGVAVNAGAFQNLAQGGSPYWTWSASVSYDRALGPKLTGFLETYLLAPSRGIGPASHFADTGVQVLVSNDLMLDGFAGTEIDRGRQAAFFGCGMSVRF